MKPMIIEDAGHGGMDSGAVGIFLEKDITLDMALYKARRFNELGITTILTRDKDITLVPYARALRVRTSGARLCISDHINAGGGTGAEAWVSIHSDQRWARLVLEALAEVGWPVHRGIKTRTLPENQTKDYYFMHRETGDVETLLMEWGFIDSKDAAKLWETWPVLAEAGVKGTCKYLGVPYSPPQLSLSEAVNILADNGISKSPDYWLEMALPGKTVPGEHVGQLIKNMAEKLKGG